MTEHIIETEGCAGTPFVPIGGTDKLHEEIVRCRDCRMFDPKEGAMLACKFEVAGFTQWRLAEPDGFCSWGEPRGDAE